MLRRALLPVGLLGMIVACSSSSDPPAEADAGPAKPPKYTPAALPAVSSAQTTREATLVPTRPRQAPVPPNPAKTDGQKGYLDQGFGELAAGPGEAYVTRTIDGSTPPAAGPNAKRVARFVHVADFQIADDESPTRLSGFDTPAATSSAARPQDAELCRMANASVRTINALHKKEAFDFVLLGGDNADSAQTNEVEWVLSILSGAPSVECDSGDDNDPVPGADNDGKDPFVAEGLVPKWLWVTGNHDVLVQGNNPVGPNSAKALGQNAPGGTRDYGESGGNVRSGEFVVADPKRALLDRKALMAKIAADKDGHGIGAKQKETGKAIFTHDVPGSPLRMLVIDTSAETGGAEGIIHRADIDAQIKPALDAAKAEGKWVVLASHHATSSLSLDGGTFGTKQADAVTEAEWEALVGGYPNVLFSMVGHTHQHRVKAISPQGGHAFWEVMTAAIADFPHQFRTIEIFDQDNGWVMMRATAVDFSIDGDAVAARGRKLGTMDWTSGWLPGDGPGQANERNVELWIKKP
ncbi:MAG: metallophosphoesterase [Myxococcales bacterium]|nr:metallophosphoesterase [Myxococcales bacterium]